MKKTLITIQLLAILNLYGMDPIDQWELTFDAVRAPMASDFEYDAQPLPEMTPAVAAYYSQLQSLEGQADFLVETSQPAAQAAEAHLGAAASSAAAASSSAQAQEQQAALPVAQPAVAAAASSASSSSASQVQQAQQNAVLATALSMQLNNNQSDSEESSDEEMDDDVNDEDYVDAKERSKQNKKRNRGKRKLTSTKAQDVLKDKVVSRSLKQTGNSLKDKLVKQVKRSEVALGERHECTIEDCNLSFTNARSMKLHIRSDHKDKLVNEPKRKHACTYENCTYSFDHRKKLLRHVNRKHKDGIGLHPCTEAGCSRSFANKSAISRHLNTFHKQGQPVARCEPCKHDFYQMTHLNKHLTCDVEFKCEKCGESVHHSEYDLHMTSHKK